MKNQGKNLGAAIKRARTNHRLRYSQSELGALLNLCAQAVSNVERGKSSLKLSHVMKLSRILDVSFESLVAAMVKDYEEALYAESYRILDESAETMSHI